MWAVHLVNKRSTTVGHAFWDWYINHYTPMNILVVPPIFVQVDNCGEFIMLNTICIGLGCHVVRSLPHVPQSNALVERSIGTLKRVMAKLIHIRHQSYIAISNNNVYGIVGN